MYLDFENTISKLERYLQMVMRYDRTNDHNSIILLSLFRLRFENGSVSGTITSTLDVSRYAAWKVKRCTGSWPEISSKEKLGEQPKKDQRYVR